MHFNDHTHFLRDPKYSQDWTINDLATSPTDVDCGPMVASFQYRQGGDLDSSIFNVVTGSNPNKFEILSTEDESKVNQYEIIYIVKYNDYQGTSVSSQDFFEIEIIDKCDEPVSISPSTLVNQEYTVTGAS